MNTNAFMEQQRQGQVLKSFEQMQQQQQIVYSAYQLPTMTANNLNYLPKFTNEASFAMNAMNMSMNSQTIPNMNSTFLVDGNGNQYYAPLYSYPIIYNQSIPLQTQGQITTPSFSTNCMQTYSQGYSVQPFQYIAPSTSSLKGEFDCNLLSIRPESESATGNAQFKLSNINDEKPFLKRQQLFDNQIPNTQEKIKVDKNQQHFPSNQQVSRVCNINFQQKTTSTHDSSDETQDTNADQQSHYNSSAKSFSKTVTDHQSDNVFTSPLSNSSSKQVKVKLICDNSQFKITSNKKLESKKAKKSQEEGIQSAYYQRNNQEIQSNLSLAKNNNSQQTLSSYCPSSASTSQKNSPASHQLNPSKYDKQRDILNRKSIQSQVTEMWNGSNEGSQTTSLIVEQKLENIDEEVGNIMVKDEMNNCKQELVSIASSSNQDNQQELDYCKEEQEEALEIQQEQQDIPLGIVENRRQQLYNRAGKRFNKIQKEISRIQEQVNKLLVQQFVKKTCNYLKIIEFQIESQKQKFYNFKSLNEFTSEFLKYLERKMRSSSGEESLKFERIRDKMLRGYANSQEFLNFIVNHELLSSVFISFIIAPIQKFTSKIEQKDEKTFQNMINKYTEKVFQHISKLQFNQE